MGLLTRLKGGKHPEVATIMMNLAVFYSQLRKLDTALPLAQKALRIQVEVFGPDFKDLMGSYMNVAHILMGTKDIYKMPQALDMYGKAIKIAEQTRDKNDKSLAHLYFSRGKLLLRMKARAECIAEFDKAVAILDAQPDPENEDNRCKMIRKFANKV